MYFIFCAENSRQEIDYHNIMGLSNISDIVVEGDLSTTLEMTNYGEVIKFIYGFNKKCEYQHRHL